MIGHGTENVITSFNWNGRWNYDRKQRALAAFEWVLVNIRWHGRQLNWQEHYSSSWNKSRYNGIHSTGNGWTLEAKTFINVANHGFIFKWSEDIFNVDFRFGTNTGRVSILRTRSKRIRQNDFSWNHQLKNNIFQLNKAIRNMITQFQVIHNEEFRDYRGEWRRITSKFP